jgi:3-hydroxyisobutyrate dehydrogenase
MAERVALIGVGIMGAGMASNWLKKGFEVSVYNRTRAKAEPLGAAGARIASSPADAARDADYIVAMVSDDDASRAVWLGENGALAAAKPGAVLIETSTLTPHWIRDLAGKAKAAGLGFLEAPVGGSKGAAADGKLTMFIGGSEETLAKARHVLDAVSVKVTRIGDNGAGATWKLINNMMAGSQLAILAEGMAFARKAGIDMAIAEELIRNGPTASPIVNLKLPRIAARSFDNPDFALDMYAKDLRYILDLAKEVGLALEMAPGAAKLVTKAREKGHGEKDFASIAEALGY